MQNPHSENNKNVLLHLVSFIKRLYDELEMDACVDILPGSK
jgi:hypothetical protein